MDIKAPDLGVESAEVSEIMVAVGDVIAKDDNIILLESDKASVEVPSSAAGKVSKINVDVGDQVSEGMVLIEVDSDADSGADDESDDSSKNEQKQPEADTENSKSTEVAATNNDKAEQTKDKSDTSEPEESTGRATTHALPDLGVEEAQVAEIMVSVGDNVTADDSILLIESDKASVEVPAPETGTIEKILVQAGDMVANGQDFIVIVGSSADNTNSSDNSSTADNQTSKKDSEAKQSANESAFSEQHKTGEPKQAAA
ncbi:MAG: biotin/lipoyl-containing protein, partial [Psychrobacter sp.]